jgi:UDP-N-acetyl-D-glucosamine dehydrogenase
MEKNMFSGLKKKIIDRKARIAVIGLGYVGLPLAVEFKKAGFDVIGIDSDTDRVDSINRRQSYILDITSQQIKECKLKASADFEHLSRADVCIICVPTPLRKTKDPDISYIISALEKIARYLHKGQLVVLESTTYPGTTEEVILPQLSASGLKCGKDFYLAFSPERIDPGNERFKTANIPKVVGGINKESGELAKVLYESIVTKAVVVSSSKVAELVKLLENTFRIVNIGLINEFALLCNKLGVDVWEVIEAAKTKPFGFMPFYPGPGIGGHCIPKDPLYLSWKAREYGFEARFIQLASQMNNYMPVFVVEKITAALNKNAKPIKGSRILVIGVAYKKDVKDLRESPALEIIENLKRLGAVVSYHDPYIPYLKIDHLDLKSEALTAKNLKGKDCVAIITDHSNVDYGAILKHAPLIMDTRNALKGANENVVKL